jgi:F-type H+-transporting ATPase subunit gamma
LGYFQVLAFDNVRRAAIFAQQAFLSKEYDRIELVYSQFKNAATQNFVAEPYLPIPKVEKEKGHGRASIFHLSLQWETF